MPKAQAKLEGLLKKINRTAPPDEPAPEAVAKPEEKAAEGKYDGRIHIWLQPRDSQQLRELAAWLAGQGERIADAQILRAALRLVKPNGAFLEAYREAAKLDGRKR